MRRLGLILCCLMICVASQVQAQPDNYVDWNNAGQPDISTGGGPTPQSALGGLTTFPDRPTFQAAIAGNLSSEDFEGGATGPGGLNVCNEPLNSASNDPCFLPGQVVAGFNLTSSSGGGLVALGDGFLGQPTTVVGPNFFADTADVTFTGTNIDAVAVDIISSSGPAATVTVTVLDTLGGTIGTIGLTLDGAGLGFVGFTSPVSIGGFIVSDDIGGGELIDNLQFGSSAPPPPIPTLSPAGLAILIVMVLLTATVLMRRKSA